MSVHLHHNMFLHEQTRPDPISLEQVIVIEKVLKVQACFNERIFSIELMLVTDSSVKTREKREILFLQ